MLFRKKPVVIEAIQWDGTLASYNEIAAWQSDAPFGSVGGLAARPVLVKPEYVSDKAWPDYRRGYIGACISMFGPDWATVSFSWVPVLDIDADGAHAVVTIDAQP